MSGVIIKAENIGKKYTILHSQRNENNLLLGSVASTVKSIFNFKTDKKVSEEFVALQNINFEINKGDRVGIIGRNGAGKSTLLKILSRIVKPTSGTIEYEGRMASLLEVGTGFHGDLSGRENIYLNGSILGMKKNEIDARFDEIVAFAEVEQFLDTPVKRYSSGMYVRLAFSVAAHLESDILIIDEVLAVGDSTFQKKCLGKMEDVSANQGKTILFVSHSIETVLRLCNKGLLLERGQIKAIGEMKDVAKAYLDTNTGLHSKRFYDRNDRHNPGGDKIKLISVIVHDANFENKEEFDITQPIGISMEYEVVAEDLIFTHSYNFNNEEGINIFNTHDTVSDFRKEKREKGVYKTTMWIQPNLLAEGVVLVNVAAIKIEPFTILFHELSAVSFTVMDYMRGDSARGEYMLGFPGAVRPLCNWTTIKK
ncbi:MAG: ABC transporter ATP-binding protein [Bacteroidota bacterium]|nr:ABC transporter ATP-binding protein [Bacteroidota bacterium]